MNLNRKGQAQIVIVILLVLFVVTVFYVASSGPPKKEVINIHRFEAKPSKFKTSETGELLFKVENLVENDFTTITAYLETHKNVEIYLGSNLLAIEGGNYTYTKVLSPKETSDLVFRLKATVDIGDNQRDYQVRIYVYVNNIFFTTKVAAFSAQADN